MRIKIIIVAVFVVAVAIAVWRKPARPELRVGFYPEENIIDSETQRVLDDAEHFTLLSIDPTHPAFQSKAAPPKETFHDYQVLGKTEIRTAEERRELLAALYEGIREADGVLVECFNPRHGISAQLGRLNVDLLICFECKSLKAFTYAANGETHFIARSPQVIFNRAVEKAGLATVKER